MSDPRICDAFDVIARYAQREGWIPIGWRDWRVGPWRIRVNGTKAARDGLAPFHALIEHDTYIGLMVIHPCGGTVGGWKDTEAEFIAAMKDALAQPSPEVRA